MTEAVSSISHDNHSATGTLMTPYLPSVPLWFSFPNQVPQSDSFLRTRLHCTGMKVERNHLHIVQLLNSVTVTFVMTPKHNCILCLNITPSDPISRPLHFNYTL